MRSATLIISICLFSLLTACSTTWYKRGATKQDFIADRQDCIAESYREAPVANTPVQMGIGNSQPIYTNCTGSYNNVNCTSTGGGYVPPPHIDIDQNISVRDVFFKDCMYKHGWSTVRP